MQGKNKQIQILFFCTFPEYKKGTDKLLGVTEHICQITVLGDKYDEFFWQWVRWWQESFMVMLQTKQVAKSG